MVDRDKIYNQDHKENMKLFRDLKLQHKYSVYSSELNKVFGDNSYDKFYKNLIEHKNVRINNFKKLFEKPVVKGGIKTIESPFNIMKFTNGLKNMKLKQEKLEYKIKHPHIPKFSPVKEIKEMLKKSRSTKNQVILPDIPDIGRYNPNYQSIRTHSFNPHFSYYDFTDFNKYKSDFYAHQFFLSNNKKNESPNQNIIQNKYMIKNINSRSKPDIGPFKTEPNNDKNSDNNKSTIKSNELEVSQYLSTSSLGDEKRNHCLKFDSYSPRKPMVSRPLYETEVPLKTKDFTPIKSIKGNYDFNKISSFSHLYSFFDEIVKNNNNPPLGMYKPNYDFVSKKPVVDIYLDKKEPSSPKLAKLKKIIYSYNTTKEYQMVSTLNDIKKDKAKFDINK